VEDDDFLAHLSPADRAELEALGTRTKFSTAAVLFREGEEGRLIHIPLDGLVKVWTSSSSGKEVILDVVETGAVLGELSAIDGGPRSASATALTEVECLVVPVLDFLAFLEEHPGAATQLLSMVAARLRRTSQRQLEFGTSDSLTRLCRCILTMVERYGGGNEHVALPFAQHDVAAMTGLSREAVVKGLRALRDLGWIDARGREIRILDEPSLRSRAHT
jgi:CRP/FNR family cyclic AMP-dependent transcriptional regulator